MLIKNLELIKIFSALSHEKLSAWELFARAVIARNFDSPIGFENFYQIVYGRKLPDHALNDWVKPIYTGWNNGLGTVIEAFRGSTKTTTLTIAWVAFRIGHEPQKSNLLIQVGDDIAKDNAQQIAEIIAYNPGWKRVFPRVSPDYDAGWGGTGYEVQRTDISYHLWRRLCSQEKGKDPTFVGLGYKSRAIIGKHPTGVLLIDDIHDENNSASPRELERVRKIVSGTILPTVRPDTWQVVVGTPWTENDVLAYIKATGRFQSVRTPILDENNPIWPQVFPLEEIEKHRQLAGEIEFARMFLLDLKAASGVNLKREWLHAFPHERINPSWPVVMGVDYASTADNIIGSRRDYFAVSIGRILPGGAGVVLVDGIRKHVS